MLALPIFAVVMFIVYYVSVTTVGGIATDWANDGVFGDGWYPVWYRYEQLMKKLMSRIRQMHMNVINAFVDAMR